MTFSAADAIINMADSLIDHAMTLASEVYDYEFEMSERLDLEGGVWAYMEARHYPDIDWDCRFLRIAIADMWYFQESLKDDRKDEFLCDEIPF